MMLVLSMGARVCLGLAFVVGTLLLVTAGTMPEAMGNYLAQLPLNLRVMQIDQTYMWERHATFAAFWRLLFQGRGPGETRAIVSLLTTASVSLVVFALGSAWWRTRKPGLDDVWTGETRSLARDRLIGATITAMPLMMPFYFDYDLMLLAVPAVLLAGEILAMQPGAQLDRMQRLLVGSWCALYLWLIVNPPVASASCVNVTVVLLSTVCALSITRATSVGIRTSRLISRDIHRV